MRLAWPAERSTAIQTDLRTPINAVFGCDIGGRQVLHVCIRRSPCEGVFTSIGATVPLDASNAGCLSPESGARSVGNALRRGRWGYLLRLAGSAGTAAGIFPELRLSFAA